MGVLRQSVIRDPKRRQLRFGQVPDLDDWNLRHPELLCRKQPTMPNHNVTEVVDHHRHQKPKFTDAICNLVDLGLRMLSRIAGIKNETFQRPILNPDFDQPRVSRFAGAGSALDSHFGLLLRLGGSNSNTPNLKQKVYS